MPRIKEITLYQFDELDDAAKNRAMDWYREGGPDHAWWGSCYEQAATAGAILGIDLHTKGRKAGPTIYFSGFSSQGDGACFEGTWRYAKGWRKALRAEFGGDLLKSLEPIGQALQDAAKRQLYQVSAVCNHRGSYYHSGCMAVEVTHDDSTWRDIGDTEGEVRDALRQFADWIYGSLESEHDWLQADEQVADSIRANEYEFNKDGSRA